MATYDVAVVGAGIVGLAHALAAAKRGKRVVVIEKDGQANGASIRNFGFVTVTGQEMGDCWEKAFRSRQIWDEVAEAARIPVLHRGLLVTARRPEAEAVIDAFLETPMGAATGCRRLTLAQARQHMPHVGQAVTAALHSPHEMRVESRTAVASVARWLAEAHGVEFRFHTAVTAVAAPVVTTTGGTLHADAVVVCPGDNYTSLFAERIAAYGLTRTKLQMLRVVPGTPVALCAAIMSDLGLARYQGYAALPEATALKVRLAAEQGAHVDAGVHLIAVQSADGSLVVGDSHEYDPTPHPFREARVDDLILSELDAVLDLGPYTISEQWLGTYAVGQGRWRLTDAPDEATRIVIVTAGCGASTAFAIGEETVAAMFDSQPAMAS